MRVLLFFYFSKSIIYKRNEILLIIVVSLIKYVFNIAIKRIDFYLQRSILIIIV